MRVFSTHGAAIGGSNETKSWDWAPLDQNIHYVVCRLPVRTDPYALRFHDVRPSVRDAVTTMLLPYLCTVYALHCRLPNFYC